MGKLDGVSWTKWTLHWARCLLTRGPIIGPLFLLYKAGKWAEKVNGKISHKLPGVDEVHKR